MATNIENNVVSMSFDNSNFEKNAHTTLGTLDKLKKSLNFTGAANSLNEVSAAARGVDMSPLQNGIQEVHNRFSALEVVAFSVLNNITNRAVDAGMRIGRALTIEGMLDGFQEYELTMNSIQTLMNGTGESLERVMDSLNDLNEYADLTIYSFSDMTSNMTKFTNQGISLDDTTTAMKGIANWAAYAGVGTQQAASAMYNLGQALGRGYVQLIDWRSIMNAGMDTNAFKEQALEIAMDLGTVNEAMLETYGIQGMFSDALGKENWLTNDVLIKTLKVFTDTNTELGKKATEAATQIKTFTQLMDTIKESIGTGWAQTMTYIFGDLDQAKELWTSIGDYLQDIIGASAKARNALFEVWSTNSGGRATFIKGLADIFKSLDYIGKTVGSAFREIFPAMSALQLIELTKAFSEFASNLRSNVLSVLGDIHDIAEGAFAVLHMGVNIVTSLGRAFVYLVDNSGLGGLAKSLLGLGGSFGEYLKSLDKAITENDVFFNVLKKVADALLLIPNGLSAVFRSLTGMGFAEAIGAAADSLGNFLGYLLNLSELIGSGISAKIDSLRDAFGGLGTEAGILEIIFKGVANGLKSIASVIFDIVGQIWTSVSDTFGAADTGDMMSFINTAGLAGALSAFLVQLKNILDPLDDFGDMITNIREDLAILQVSVKADAILKIAEALALMAVSCLLLASVDADKLAAPMIAITTFVTELSAAMHIMSMFSGTSSTFGEALRGIMDAAAQNQSTTILLKLAASVLILSVALKSISSIDPDRLLGSMLALTALLTELTAAAILLNKFGGKIHTGGFITMALGLVIISKALKVIAGIEPESLGIAIGAVTIMLLELTTAISVLSNFSSVGMMTGSAAILLVANAMIILSGAVKILSTMSLTEIGIAMVAMVGGLAAVSTAISVLSMFNPVTLLAGAAALTVAVGAVVILSGALKLLATISPEGLVVSMTALVVSLTSLAIAMAFMQTSIGGAAALIIAAGAIAILAPALALLAAVPFTSMLSGLLAMAIAIGGLAVASSLLTPLIPAMLSLSATLLVFGAACTLIGAGVLALSAGLASLAVSGVAGATAFVGIISVLLGAIPMIVTAIELFVQTMIRAYMDTIPLLMQAAIETINMLCQTLLTCAPTLINTATTLLLLLLNTIAANIQQFVEAGITIVTGIINGIAAKLPDLIDAMFNLVIALIDGLGVAIEEHAVEIREAMIRFAEHLWNGFCEFFGIHSPSTKMQEGGVFLMEGLINGIGGMIDTVVSKIGEVKTAILNKLGEKLSEFATKGRNMMTKVKEGANSMKETLRTSVGSIATSMKEGIRSKYEEFKSAGAFLMQGLANGVGSMADAVRNKAAEIGSSVLARLKASLDEHSPSKATTEMGQFLDQGLINGMVNLRRNVVNTAVNVANSVMKALTDNVSDTEDLFDDEFNFSPVIRPVLDLSGIQNGVSRISDMFNDDSYDAVVEIKESRESKRRSSDRESEKSNGTTVINNIDITQKNESPKPINSYEMYRNNKKLVDMIQGATQ